MPFSYRFPRYRGLAFILSLFVSIVAFSHLPAAAPVPAVMTTPNAGSTLAGSSVGFGWTSAAGATQYWLYVGTSTGAYDIYNQNQSTRLSVLVGNLPMDGRTIYVRLWSFIGGLWYTNDYRYVAYKQPSQVAATMIFPENGSALTGTTVRFSWTNTSAQEYSLSVGRTLGAAEFYSGSEGVATSRTVSNLPADGTTVFVRLRSRFGTSWLSHDYSYTAYKRPPIAAVITSPQNGSTLSSTTATFSWTNTFAQEYWLYIGKTFGGTDLYNSSQGALTSRTVNGLPKDGSRVFLRLRSRFGTSWVYNDDDYLAFRPLMPGTVITSKDSNSKYALLPVNVFSSERGQCTWYVYGRVMELIAGGYLPSTLASIMSTAFDPVAHMGQRNASQWPLRLGGHWVPTSASSALPFDHRRAGLLAVYPGPFANGHVGFVEEVSSDKKRYRMSQFNRTNQSEYNTSWYYFDKADVPAGSAIDADGSLGPAPPGGGRYYPAFYDPSDSKW
jgi:hypothetical protein